MKPTFKQFNENKKQKHKNKKEIKIKKQAKVLI